MVAIREILRTLAEHDVEYIVVGGVAAVLNGAPVHTFDVDIVYNLQSHNIDRLLAALLELDATFRGDSRRLRPNASHLKSKGHKLLTTKHGDLDCLGTIEEDTSYQDLLADSELFELSDFTLRVLSLERLLRVKEQLTRDKDKAALPILRATLDERRRRQE